MLQLQLSLLTTSREHEIADNDGRVAASLSGTYLRISEVCATNILLERGRGEWWDGTERSSTSYRWSYSTTDAPKQCKSLISDLFKNHLHLQTWVK